ncbi:acyl-CoA synthetase [Tamilnaduibacter salinus]|uniref:Acyl-CoA synthetase n=1 Tax=Tamilnaduibacter salinus TaxID=1484056 RepID=A0A2A2I4V6_9GAMM|nr:AMP-binding protein [Tamilnaduibacter salinus]PAV26314.1 acyl-CoA synthetase [Tamilnaduibacter salinus]
MNPAIETRAVRELLNEHSTPLQLLRRAASRQPNKPALVYLPSADSNEPVSVSYRDLLTETQKVAGAIRAIGVQPDESVAVFLPLIPQAVSALIATTSVAMAFPVNLLLSAEAVSAQFKRAGTRLVITMGEHPALDVRDRVGQAVEQSDGITLVELPLGTEPSPGSISWGDFVGQADHDPAPEEPDPDPRRVAALIHTGGTTGEPKLAGLTQRNLAAGGLMAASGFGYRSEDRIVSGLPLFHVGGLVDVVLASIAAESTVVFPTALGLRNPDVIQNIWSILDRVAGTIIGGVPTMLSAIADAPRHGYERSTLRAAVTGGAPLAMALAERVEKATDCPVRQLYGMTETAGIVCNQAIDGPRREPCAGKPVPLSEVSLGEPGAPLESGASGELYVRGPHVFAGYLTEHGIQKEEVDGWIRSGDLAVLEPTGDIRLTGRSKDIIIRGGHNIDPMVIEEVAMSHPAVAEAAAIAMPDAYAGELPVLYVRYHDGAAAAGNELKDFIAEKINEPPARPKEILPLDEFPYTAIGKIARYRLRQFAAEHAVASVLNKKGVVGRVVSVDPQAGNVTIHVEQALHPEESAGVKEAVQALGLTVRLGTTDQGRGSVEH